MGSNKNTPQNVNNSPDKKKGDKEKTRRNPKGASNKEKNTSGSEGTGIGGSQLGTQDKRPEKKPKGTSREVRDLG